MYAFVFHFIYMMKLACRASSRSKPQQAGSSNQHLNLNSHKDLAAGASCDWGSIFPGSRFKPIPNLTL